MGELTWRDEYNVGCDIVDSAHRKLFGVLRKVEALLREKDFEKNKFACIEGMKFLQNYTETHFRQEEGYMLSIGYEGYEHHKKLHDELREETLPVLEKKLEASDYSRESMKEFVGVFAGWLAGHILIEDQAIAGKAISAYVHQSNDADLLALENEMGRILCDFTDEGVSVVNDNYLGEALENAMYYEMQYDKSKVIFAAQNSLVFGMVGRMLGIEATKMDKEVLLAYVEMVHSFVRPALIIFSPEDVDCSSKKQIIDSETLSGYFKDGKAEYSVKWNTQYGQFALCIFK